jgi:hypothetical protein
MRGSSKAPSRRAQARALDSHTCRSWDEVIILADCLASRLVASVWCGVLWCHDVATDALGPAQRVDPIPAGVGALAVSRLPEAPTRAAALHRPPTVIASYQYGGTE